jgi:galactose mutarotase-like enzyme
MDFLSEYDGGWHELFPNAGASCEVLGARLPFHGEVARARWEVVSVDATSIELRTPTRLPLVLRRRLFLDGFAVRVEETVENESAIDVPVIWGHHPVFTARAGMRIDLPAARVRADDGWRPGLLDLEPGGCGVWPMAPSPTGPVDVSVVPDRPVERFCFVDDLAEPWAALRDPVSGVGVGYAFDPAVFRHLWLWLQIGGAEFPWYGRTSYVAIEPHSTGDDGGLADAIARDDALRVPARGQLATWLTIALFDAGDAPVTGVDRAGTVDIY